MKIIILKLLPLLLLYIVLVVILSSAPFQGDEGGYVAIADRLSQGHYSPISDIKLWWGPGYPIVLTPFVYFKIPWLVAKFLNALFLFGALLYLNKTLTLWLQETCALFFTYILGIYPPFLRELHLLLSENLVFFLICGFMFHFCKFCREEKGFWLHLLAAALFLGYLALTKVFFGYVIISGLLSFLILFLLKKKEHYKRTTLMYLLALTICLPYLKYTYFVTGKIFYWGTSGGMSLYWMSTPYEDEWGSWFSSKDVQEDPKLARHREFFDKIAGFSEVERDAEFKKQAIYNIIHHPTKYFVNWIANIGRLLFSYPFSHGQDRLTTYFYLIPNMFIVVLFVLSIYPAFLRWKVIPFEIYALLYFSTITFGGSSIISAYDRQFRILVPIILLWISFLYTRAIKIEIRPELEIKNLLRV